MKNIPFCIVSAVLVANPAPAAQANGGSDGMLLLASSERRITSQSATALRRSDAIRVQPQSPVSRSVGSTVQSRPLNPAIRSLPAPAPGPGSRSTFMMQKAKTPPPLAQPGPPAANLGPGASGIGATAPFGTQPAAFPPAAASAAAPVSASLLDVFAGREILGRLDPADQSIVSHTARNALENFEDNTVVSWASPITGNQGSVTPLRTFKLSDWTPCRDYQVTLTVAGRSDTGYGSACRGGDGSWQIKR